MSKENRETFLRACALSRNLSEDVRSAVEGISRSHMDDFSSAGLGHFSEETKNQISHMAGTKLSHCIADHADVGQIRAQWIKIVRDFHQNNHWGFQTTTVKEKKKKEQSGYRTGWVYFITFFNSIVVIKTAVLFIGAEAAVNPDPKYKIYLGIAIAFSFLNLFWFAYRQYKMSKQDHSP